MHYPENQQQFSYLYPLFPGNPTTKHWVERFKLQFSDDGKVWESYKDKGAEKVV